MNTTIDVEAEAQEAAQEAKPSQALTVRDAREAVQALDAKPQITAAQAKIEAVAAVTHTAYARASELKLTPEEITALSADFPDEAFKPGAAGKENLIYIEHAFLRDRLNSVFGPGQWALIPRNRWGEDFHTANGKEATRIYTEAMLMVRGCFVAEAVGDMTYYKNNDSQNYGDAVEGAKTAALRRCCKEFGIGLQAWKKDWCNGWWTRKNAAGKAPVSNPRNAPPPPAPAARATNSEPPKHATDATRNWMIEQLSQFREIPGEYFRVIGQILPNENLEDLPLEFVPINKEQLQTLIEAIRRFEQGDRAERAYPPNPTAPMAKTPVGQPKKVAPVSDDPNDPDAPNAAWRSFKMPFGKDKDTALADLDKKTLFGWWANYVVEDQYQGRPKKPETIAKDQQFRDFLDAAGKHYNFTKDE